MWINRHKTLATAIGVFALSFLLIFVAVVPIYKNTSKLSVKIKTQSAELESITGKVTILSQLDPNVLAERVKVLDSAVPPRKDILLYLNSIQGLSDELGLKFGGLSLTPGDITVSSGSAIATTTPKNKKVSTRSASGLKSLDTEIKMSGGKESVYSFLRTIENVLPLMQIQDIKVSVLGSDQYGLTVSLGMLWAEPAEISVKGAVTLFGAEEDKYFNQLAEYRRFEPTIATDGTSNNNKTDLFQSFVNTTSTTEVITPQQ